jgi:hypothetical protein
LMPCSPDIDRLGFPALPPLGSVLVPEPLSSARSDPQFLHHRQRAAGLTVGKNPSRHVQT